MNVIIAIVLILWNVFWVYRKTRYKESLHVFFYLALLIVHFVAFFLFYKNSVEIERDSFLFHKNALEVKTILDFQFIGSQFMSALVYPFAKLGINYLTLSFLFASISFTIFLKYIEFILELYSKRKSKIHLILALFFLTPSLHYWTAGLSKEAIIVLFMGVIFFNVISNKFFSIPFYLSLLFILLIRPYLFIIIIFSLGLHIYFSKNFSKQFKRNVLVLTILGVIISAPVLKHFFKIESINFEFFSQKYDGLITYSAEKGLSSIDLKNSNYFERVFLVLFRPFFYDATSFFQYLISLENLLFLTLIIKFGYDCLKRKVKFLSTETLFVFSTSVILILFYGIYMYNLGLASRMRCMFMPYLYMFIFLSYYRSIIINEEAYKNHHSTYVF